MICTNCYQRDVCPHKCKDHPALAECADRQGCWHFDRLRLEKVTADRDRLAAELLAVREELGRVRRNHLRRSAKLAETMNKWGISLLERIATGDLREDPEASTSRIIRTVERCHDYAAKAHAALSTTTQSQDETK